MKHAAHSRFAWCHLAWQAVIVGIGAMPSAAAEKGQTELAAQARPYLLRGDEQRLLESLRRFVDAAQWDEAIDVALRLQDSESDGLVARNEEVYVGLRETIHQIIARLPAYALSRYRGLVDPNAEVWYREGITERDAARLQRVTDRSFCSSWGDEALLALGELALEQGDYALARQNWMQLDLAAAEERLIYPDSDVNRSDINARLALVSIREGDWSRAKREIEQLAANHPDARGRFGGRDVLYADYLASLLQQAQRWPPRGQDENWLTFARDDARTAANETTGRSNYQQLWSQPLGPSTSNPWSPAYPIVVENQIVYPHDGALHVIDLATGKQLFVSRRERVAATGQSGLLGLTLSSAGHRVLGTTNRPLEGRRLERRTDSTCGVWGIDLERDGALDFRWEPGDASVIYVGAPVVQGSRLLVAMRSGGHTARAGIACYDLGLRQPSWHRWLCRSNSHAPSSTNEIPHNLLTLDAGIVYTCPNLGVIAALRARDGKLLWLRSYERFVEPTKRDGDSRIYRGPNPAIYARGRLYVLPTDSRKILALDGATGHELWRWAISDSTSRIVGVVGDRVVLFNREVQLLGADRGEILATNDQLQLIGCPAAVGNTIYWPTDDAIYAMDATTAETIGPALPLPESGGANLAIAGTYIVAAGPTQITVFRAVPNRDQVSQLP